MVGLVVIVIGMAIVVEAFSVRDFMGVMGFLLRNEPKSEIFKDDVKRMPFSDVLIRDFAELVPKRLDVVNRFILYDLA